MNAARRGWQILFGDVRAIALVEFAYTAPVLILLFVGGYQLTDAVSAHRKLTLTTRAVADLASQYSEVDSEVLDDVLSASQQVMAPFDASRTQIVLSQVKIDANRVATVDWSRAHNGTAHVVGSTFDIDSDIAVPGTALIVAQTSYDYQPSIAPEMFGSILLTDKILMSPRKSKEVKKITP